MDLPWDFCIPVPIVDKEQHAKVSSHHFPPETSDDLVNNIIAHGYRIQYESNMLLLVSKDGHEAVFAYHCPPEVSNNLCNDFIGEIQTADDLDDFNVFAHSGREQRSSGSGHFV